MSLSITMVMLLVLATGLALVLRRQQGHTGRAVHADWAPVLAELDRARRYDHGVALLQLRGGDLRVDGRCLRHGDEHDPALVLRRTDTAWGDPGRVQVLVPEVVPGQLDSMLRRLRTRLGPAVEVRAACFPADGLTLGALIRTLDAPPPSPATRDVDVAAPATTIHVDERGRTADTALAPARAREAS